MINATLTINVPLDSAAGMTQTGARGGAAAPQLGGAQFGGAQGGGGIDALVDTLAEALMQALFQKKGDGATFNNPGNNPLMEMIAKFMDQNSSNYGGPHDATGSVSNWQDEVREDNYLDKQELAEFSRGLKDALASFLGGSGGLAGGLMGSAMGGGGGSMLGGALGNDGGGAMRGLGSQNGGLGVGPGFGGGAMGNMSPMGQSGFVTGGNFASHVGKTAVDSIDFKESGFRFEEAHLNGGQRFSIDKEDKDMAKEIAKYMDQNPEKYGPAPKNGGWAGRIENGKDFNQDEMNRFKQAMNDVKGVMDGQSTGNQQTDMDAMLLSNSLINQAMHKIAA